MIIRSILKFSGQGNNHNHTIRTNHGYTVYVLLLSVFISMLITFLKEACLTRKQTYEVPH